MDYVCKINSAFSMAAVQHFAVPTLSYINLISITAQRLVDPNTSQGS